MNEELHIVTVGRYRIGRLLQKQALLWEGGARHGARITHVAASFEEAAEQVLALHAREPIDGLVAAGASGARLREAVAGQDLPVAMVEVRGLDLLKALRQARLLITPEAPRVGLALYGAISPEVEQFDALFGLGLVQCAYQGPGDAHECVRQLQAQGVGAVVAPGLVADLAEQAGMAGVLLYSEAAARQAIGEAVLLARLRQARHRPPGKPSGGRRGRNASSDGGVRWRLEDYLGQDEAVRRTRELARRYAASDATVLIQGESGTGKEMLAQGLHCASSRAARPFLAVNCAALADSLLESELFGHEEGAFTGARRGGKTGLVEAAHGGSLFLDEIGDMPLELQSRLLRVLQEREVLRVGATSAVPVDVRVIAASHADLAELVRAGRVREDLFDRLAVLRLATPALRERGADDIAALARSLLQRHGRDLRLEPEALARCERLLGQVLERARRHDWRGNARELDNWVQRLAACRDHVLDDEGRPDWAGLYEVFPELAPRAVGAEPTTSIEHDPRPGLKASARQAELARIRQVLDEVRGDQGRACEILGISRATLWRRLRS